MDIMSDLVEDSDIELTDEQKRLLIKRESDNDRKKALESMDEKDLPLYITHPYCCEICDTSYDTWSKKTACQSKCQAELDSYERGHKVAAPQSKYNENKMYSEKEQEKFSQVLMEYTTRILAYEDFDAARIVSDKAYSNAMHKGFTKARIDLEREMKAYKVRRAEKKTNYKPQKSSMQTSYQRPQSNFVADGLRFTFWRLVFVAMFIVIIVILAQIFG